MRLTRALKPGNSMACMAGAMASVDGAVYLHRCEHELLQSIRDTKARRGQVVVSLTSEALSKADPTQSADSPGSGRWGTLRSEIKEEEAIGRRGTFAE